MREIPRPRHAVAAALLIGSAGSAPAEVIDLGAGTRSGRVAAAVLDFGKPEPAVDPVADPEAQAMQPAPVRPAATGAGSLSGTPEVEDLIVRVAEHYARHPGLRRAGLTPLEWLTVFRANIAIESGFRPSARSHAGAIGLGQLMPETARDLDVDPHDPHQNLHGSARYLLLQLQDFGSLDLALAAYNAGPDAVRRYGGVPPFAETRGHVRKVLALYHSTLGQEST